MSKNLITRLKGSVTDNTIPKIGEFFIKMQQNANSTGSCFFGNMYITRIDGECDIFRGNTTVGSSKIEKNEVLNKIFNCTIMPKKNNGVVTIVINKYKSETLFTTVDGVTIVDSSIKFLDYNYTLRVNQIYCFYGLSEFMLRNSLVEKLDLNKLNFPVNVNYIRFNNDYMSENLDWLGKIKANTIVDNSDFIKGSVNSAIAREVLNNINKNGETSTWSKGIGKLAMLKTAEGTFPCTDRTIINFTETGATITMGEHTTTFNKETKKWDFEL